MKVLIIEDEKFAQEELKRFLARVEDYKIEVLDALESVEDAVEWFDTNEEPDLVFMDIQLSDGLSFEIFNQRNITCPVVFTTAFENYAIRAFKVNSVDYLLKPIEEGSLKGALDKYNAIKNKFVEPKQPVLNALQVEKLLNLSMEAVEFKKRFIIKTGDRLRHVSVEDIAYFYSENDYTYLVAKENAKFIIDYKLDELVDLLDPNDFFRLSRKFITNIHSVKVVNKYFNSRLEVVLDPEPKDQILISRVRVPEFLSWLER
ncbi:LytTR family DNA-binding domain-containing protein [Reichenbachiella carrageenanivorans]|uniref:LytTR family DNA-binding domain-containing protein n=1 Tax=Reichenbachiella carrageenanivorans TaxID=2979869 RepID=A0ABY6D1T7_9BACT|nr:LytTR family DNA-binding domain-containing protein [Reichenbachiella carrageenanivorans]UXX80131.1 LytTR family DNA-binding domain-containing protein [Reichenbachiella carrageenanivorans]